jgi:hypothetical protein
MDRRDFLRIGAGCIAISGLPITGCVTTAPLPGEGGSGAVALAADGTRYELVPHHHCLTITPGDGAARRAGRLGSAAGELNYPTAVVAVGALAYVVEVGNHRVQAFDAQGRSRAILGAGELFYPSGIAARGERLFVADTAHGHIVELTTGGRVVRRFGHDALMRPKGITPAGDHLLVADAGLRQVVELRDDGSIVRTFDGDWVLPRGVACDGASVYVADVSRPELTVFDRGGRRIAALPLDAAPSRVTFAGGELVSG